MSFRVGGHLGMRWAGVGAAALAMCVAGCAGTAILHHPRPVAHEHLRQGDWRLDIARDRFSDATVCQLRARNGAAIYRMGAVGFRFYARQNVTLASYRIDHGRLRTARDDLPRLITLRTPIDRGPMEHAANGLVWVPFDLLADATTITIEPQPGQLVRTFRFRGLTGLRAIALARGCSAESQFVDQ